MSALGVVQDAAAIAREILSAKEVVDPLVDYLAGVTSEKPPVLEALPPTLRSRVELERLKLRTRTIAGGG